MYPLTAPRKNKAIKPISELPKLILFAAMLDTSRPWNNEFATEATVPIGAIATNIRHTMDIASIVMPPASAAALGFMLPIFLPPSLFLLIGFFIDYYIY